MSFSPLGATDNRNLITEGCSTPHWAFNNHKRMVGVARYFEENWFVSLAEISSEKFLN